MSLVQALANFYRQRLKPIALVRVPKDIVWYGIWFTRWRVLYPALRLPRMALWYVRWRVLPPVARALVPPRLLRAFHVGLGMDLRAALRLRPVPTLPLHSHARAARDLEVPAQQIFPAATVRSNPPAVFPARLGHFVASLPASYTFPAVTLRRWPDAEVVAASNMVVVRGCVLHHDLYRFGRDYTSEELHGRLRVLPRRRAVVRLQQPVCDGHFAHAAAFTDACAPNYAHWLTEVLPRLHGYVRSGLPEGATILLDAGLHPNLLASAKAVVGERARFHLLQAGHSARVDALDVVSPGGYIPFDRRGIGTPRDGQGIFSAPALASLRRQVADVLGVPAASTPKKILIRRGNGARALLNEQALEDRLAPLGFVPVYPERLTFTEQFHLFSNVETVVGATGAAMANLIFCPPHAQVIICVSAHPGHSYGYWSNMAAAVGNSVTYVLGRVAGARHAGIHANFSIDIDTVLEAIRSRAQHVLEPADEESLAA